MIVKPHGFLIPDEVSAIHGITTARARREGIALEAALDELALDVKTYKPQRVVAHNLAFDRPIVEAEYRLLGLGCALAGLRRRLHRRALAQPLAEPAGEAR